MPTNTSPDPHEVLRNILGQKTEMIGRLLALIRKIAKEAEDQG